MSANSSTLLSLTFVSKLLMRQHHLKMWAWGEERGRGAVLSEASSSGMAQGWE